MAVTRADKEQKLQDLSAVFASVDTAILVDYKGLNVPQATDLRRQLRAARGQSFSMASRMRAAQP